jgi:protein-S-isoprenylcysteine O-methyltransferase Ste14
MSLVGIVTTLIAVGVLLWLVNTFIPMEGKIRKIQNIVVAVAVILWLLGVFGVFDHLRGSLGASIESPHHSAPTVYVVSASRVHH